MNRTTLLALAALTLAGCEQRTSSIDVRAKDGSCIRVIATGDYVSDIRTVREQGDAEQGDNEWWPCRLPKDAKVLP